jgi:hypothetical protein
MRNPPISHNEPCGACVATKGRLLHPNVLAESCSNGADCDLLLVNELVNGWVTLSSHGRHLYHFPVCCSLSLLWSVPVVVGDGC